MISIRLSRYKSAQIEEDMTNVERKWQTGVQTLFKLCEITFIDILQKAATIENKVINIKTVIGYGKADSPYLESSNRSR